MGNEATALDPRLQPGANHPPEPIAETPLSKMVVATTAANAFLMATPKAETKEQAEEAQTHVNTLTKMWNEADTDRKAKNAPWDDLVKANNDTFRLPLANADTLKKKLKKINGDFLIAQQAIIDEAKRVAAAAAEKTRREAEETRRLAAEAEARNDHVAAATFSANAEQHETLAAKQERSARPEKAGVKSAGAGRAMTMRTIWNAQVEDFGVAFKHYKTFPDVIAAIRVAVQAEADKDAANFKDAAMAPAGVKFVSRQEPV